MRNIVHTVFAQPDLFDHIVDANFNIAKMARIDPRICFNLDHTSKNKVIVSEEMKLMINVTSDYLFGRLSGIPFKSVTEFENILQSFEPEDFTFFDSLISIKINYLSTMLDHQEETSVKKNMNCQQFKGITDIIQSILDTFSFFDTLYIKDNDYSNTCNLENYYVKNESENVFDTLDIYANIRSNNITKIVNLNWTKISKFVHGEQITNCCIFSKMPNVSFVSIVYDNNILLWEKEEEQYQKMSKMFSNTKITVCELDMVSQANQFCNEFYKLVFLLNELNIKIYFKNNPEKVTISEFRKIHFNKPIEMRFTWSITPSNNLVKNYLEPFNYKNVKELTILINDQTINNFADTQNFFAYMKGSNSIESLILLVGELTNNAICSESQFTKLHFLFPESIEKLTVVAESFSLHLMSQLIKSKLKNLKHFYYINDSFKYFPIEENAFMNFDSVDCIQHGCIGEFNLNYPKSLKVLIISCSYKHAFRKGNYSKDELNSHDMKCNCLNQNNKFKHSFIMRSKNNQPTYIFLNNMSNIEEARKYFDPFQKLLF